MSAVNKVTSELKKHKWSEVNSSSCPARVEIMAEIFPVQGR